MAAPRVVIVGGNFAGLTGALELRRLLGDDVEITLISKDDKFVFIPSLIWVPFGWRRPEDISFALAPVLERAKIHFVHAPATRIDPKSKIVFTTSGHYSYDYLLIATGPYVQYEIVPGLGPNGHTYSICTLEHALHAQKGWQKLVDDPGPVLIGATQGASCFGAAYEFLFNFAHALRKARLTRKVPLTFITAEPFCGHFGIGGFKGGQQMLEFFFKRLGIRWLTNVGVKEIVPNEVHLLDGQILPFKFAMIIPPFLGVEAIRNSPGLGNEKGFIPVKPTYQHRDFSDIYAAGIAVAVSVSWQTPLSVGVPKTGYPAETMAKVAAQNIAAQIKGDPPHEEKEFGEIPALCIMDAGNMGVLILSDKMLPPRKFELLIPGPQAHWAKVAFEKYYLWKMQHGLVQLP